MDWLLDLLRTLFGGSGEPKPEPIQPSKEEPKMSYLTMEQLLMGRAKLDELPPETQANLAILLDRVNQLLTAYGKPVKVNDAYRRPQDTPKNGAAKSKHLIGAAIDLDDDEAAIFWHWVKDNLALCKSIGLWLEDPRWTHGSVGTWVHLQIQPPGSGRRIFVPSTAPASAPNLWDGRYDPSLN